MIRLTGAEWIREQVLHLRFSDGVAVNVELKDELDGPVFEPLRDIEVFKTFCEHPELHTMVWPNGVDFAPEFLHNRVTVTA